MSDQVEGSHLLIRYFSAGLIVILIKHGLYGESGRCRGIGDQVDNGSPINEWTAPPVPGDEGKEPMFDLVPFAGARGEVADMDRESGVIRERLQFHLP